MSEKFVLPKTESPQMFNAIARRYDFLNRLISFGQDTKWRLKLKEFLPAGQNLTVLDLACGTADVLITLLKDNPKIKQGIGIDLAAQMLEIGRAKIAKAGLSDRVLLQTADAQALPFLDDIFDCVTISFGIRNMPELRLALLEMYRVVKKGGRIIILEASTPEKPLMAAGDWIYLNTLMPAIGFLFSGNAKAYRYLSQTVQKFPSGDLFCKILRQFGFTNVAAHPLMGGVATIYVAEK